MSSEIVEIKRYPNRRFYDLSASKYISQEEIEKLILDGRKVEIRDSQTGDEITRAVLTRILMDRQPEKMMLFPTDMLHFILRANDVSTGFLRDYFQHSLTYLDFLSRHSPSATALARPMHWVKAWLDSMAPRNSAEGNSAEDAALPDDSLPASDENEVPVNDVEMADKLAERVEQLEERLRQLETQGEQASSQ